MEIRLEKAKIKQKILQQHEEQHKNTLREKWNEIHLMVESLLNSNCSFLSNSLKSVNKSIKLLKDCIKKIKATEMKVLISNYKDLISQGKTNKVFEVDNEEIEPNEPAGNQPTSNDPGTSGNPSNSQEDPNTGNKAFFQSVLDENAKIENQMKQEHAISLHKIGETLQTTLNLNKVLEKSFNVSNTFSSKDPCLQLLIDLKRIISAQFTTQQAILSEDEKLAKQIGDHNKNLNDFKNCLFSTPSTTSTPIVNLTAKLPIEQFRIRNLILPESGALTKSASNILKRIKKTARVVMASEGVMIYTDSSIEAPPISVSSTDNTGGISLDDLIEILVDVRVTSIYEISLTFLRCYRYFMPAEELLERLIFRFCAIPRTKSSRVHEVKVKQISVRLRVVVFIKYWLTTFPQDFHPSKRIYSLLEEFIKSVVFKTGCLDIGKQLLRHLNNCNPANVSASRLPTKSASAVPKHLKDYTVRSFSSSELIKNVNNGPLPLIATDSSPAVLQLSEANNPGDPSLPRTASRPHKRRSLSTTGPVLVKCPESQPPAITNPALAPNPAPQPPESDPSLSKNLPDAQLSPQEATAPPILPPDGSDDANYENGGDPVILRQASASERKEVGTGDVSESETSKENSETSLRSRENSITASERENSESAVRSRENSTAENVPECLVNPLVELVKIRKDVHSKRKRRKKPKYIGEREEISFTKIKVPEYKISILDFDAKVFAEQLTVYESKQFQLIKDYELLEQHFSKNKLDAPNVVKNSIHFNQLGGWIWLQIVSHASPEARAQVLKHCMMICVHLYELKNYNAVVAFIAALNNAAIARLRITWTLCGWKLFMLKEGFALLTVNNCSIYRKELQNVSPPIVPFIGMFLTDLTFLEDGNPNFIDGKINFCYKFNRISLSISQLLKFQVYEYPVEPDANYAKMFDNLPVISSHDAFAKSEEIETRENTHPYKRFEKLTPPELQEAARFLQQIRDGHAASVIEHCFGTSVHSENNSAGTGEWVAYAPDHKVQKKNWRHSGYHGKKLNFSANN